MSCEWHLRFFNVASSFTAYMSHSAVNFNVDMGKAGQNAADSDSRDDDVVCVLSWAGRFFILSSVLTDRRGYAGEKLNVVNFAQFKREEREVHSCKIYGENMKSLLLFRCCPHTLYDEFFVMPEIRTFLVPAIVRAVVDREDESNV